MFGDLSMAINLVSNGNKPNATMTLHVSDHKAQWCAANTTHLTDQ